MFLPVVTVFIMPPHVAFLDEEEDELPLPSRRETDETPSSPRAPGSSS